MTYDYFPKEYFNKLSNDFSILCDNYETIYMGECRKYEKKHRFSASFLHFNDTFSNILSVISSIADVSGILCFLLLIPTVLVYIVLLPVCFIVKKCYLAHYNRFKEKAANHQETRKTEAKTKCENAYQIYLTGFNNEVQSLTARYAEGQPIAQIADDLFFEIKQYVDHADRSSHIERIQVECSFSVVQSGILFVNWEGKEMIYSFEKARFSNLSNPVSLAAVARVLANKIQFLFLEKPNDPSGTVSTVTTNEAYERNAAVFSLTYIAPNGNYVAAQQW